MESSGLAGFALLVSIGSFLLGVFVIIAYFIATSNISSIAKNTSNMDFRQAQMQASIEKLVKLLEREKEKI